MPDYLKIARALREKANYVPPPGSGLTAVGPEEKAALLARAEELEAKYSNSKSRPTDDTTTTSRDGRPHTMTYDEFIWQMYQFNRQRPYNMPPRNDAEYERRRQNSWDILNDLLKNQQKWNDRYTNPDGTPKPGYDGKPHPDEDIVEEHYAYSPRDDDDEDYDPEGTWYT